MKVPLFTQRMIFYSITRRIFYFSHGEYFVIHTEYHGISRRFLNIDYNSDNFSVAISEKKRKSVTIRDLRVKRKTVTIRDSPSEKKISLNN